MANFNGVVYAVQIAPPSPSNWLTAGYINGREKVNMDYYVGLGTEIAGSVIFMGAPLPVGAKVLAHAMQISASIGSFAVSVGDALLATRYGTNLTLATLNTIVTAPTVLNATDGYYVIGTNAATALVPSGDTQIQLTTSGATLSIGTIIGFRTIYVTD